MAEEHDDDNVNDATRTARAVVGALLGAGVRDVVVAPGSRNAPLSFAVWDAAAAGLLRLHTRIDERSAAFVALGLSRTGAPAAVVCTSGTAVANLHPAVLEAAHAGVPLVVVTADRPARLAGTGANQTTDQVGIFGPLVETRDIGADGPPGWVVLWLDDGPPTSTCASTSRCCPPRPGASTTRTWGRRPATTPAAPGGPPTTARSTPGRARSWWPATTPARRRGCWPRRRGGRCWPSPRAGRAPAPTRCAPTACSSTPSWAAASSGSSWPATRP